MNFKKGSIWSIGVLSVIAGCLLLPTTTRADVVTDWNARAVQYASTGGRPGPSWVLDVAVVQVAIYDAVQAIEGDYQPYCGSIPGATGSVVAAAATAARDVLVARFPGHAAAIEADYSLYMIGILPTDPGIDVGHAAAECVIDLRSTDGAFPPPPVTPFTGGTLPGQWRNTGSGNLSFPWMGEVTPFTVRSGVQFSAGPPPRLTSPEYTRAYNEVKNYGVAGTGSSRSTEQTDLAHFWNGNFPGQFNRLARELAGANGLTVSESSRLMALVDVSMADSAITAWADKVRYNFWRPVTAILLGESDGNPKTIGVPGWTPLVTTPPYPDHTSGANSLAGSATRAMSLFFGTNEMEFTITTTNLTVVTDPLKQVRSYSKFSEVRDEVVEARILQGIHFRFADADARKQSEHIAQWAHAHHFKPAN